MIHRGDMLQIREEWRDPGDDEFTWVALEDEDGGRVLITPLGTGLSIPPRQVVTVEMVELSRNEKGGDQCPLTT